MCESERSLHVRLAKARATIGMYVSNHTTATPHSVNTRWYMPHCLHRHAPRAGNCTARLLCPALPPAWPHTRLCPCINSSGSCCTGPRRARYDIASGGPAPHKEAPHKAFLLTVAALRSDALGGMRAPSLAKACGIGGRAQGQERAEQRWQGRCRRARGMGGSAGFSRRSGTCRRAWHGRQCWALSPQRHLQTSVAWEAVLDSRAAAAPACSHRRRRPPPW